MRVSRYASYGWDSPVVGYVSYEGPRAAHTYQRSWGTFITETYISKNFIY